MGWSEILLIITGVITLISGVSWSRFVTRGRSLIANAKALKAEYELAKADSQITNDEKLRIAEKAMAVMNDALELWQSSYNLIQRLLGIVRRR